MDPNSGAEWLRLPSRKFDHTNPRCVDGRFAYLPTKRRTWIIAVAHILIDLVLVFLPLLLPRRFAWLAVLAYLGLFLHWLLLKECIVAWVEKLSEDPTYERGSIPCFTYSMAIPAHYLNLTYLQMRDVVFTFGMASAIYLIIVALVLPTQRFARTSLRTRLALAYLAGLVTIFCGSFVAHTMFEQCKDVDADRRHA